MLMNNLCPIIFLSATSIPTKNSLRIDSSLTIAIIIALIALISPIIVAILNNSHQTNMKKLEYENCEHTKQLDNNYNLNKYQLETYYINAINIYINLLDCVGNFLGNTSDSSLYLKAISSIHQAYAFADKDLCDELFMLRYEIASFNGFAKVKGDPITAMEALEKVALAINKKLKEPI